MAEASRTPTRQFVKIGDADVSAESGSDAEDNLQPQILGRRREVDSKINAIVAPLTTQLEKLIQPVRELSERSYNRSTERIVGP